MMRPATTIVICLMLTGYRASASADAMENRACIQEEAIEAETEASSLENWNAVYKSFKRYAHCDDGAIAEGYSASVARLLAQEWRHIETLRRLTDNEKRFEGFVIRHIDETWSPDEAAVVVDNTRAHCPPKAQKLCRRILNAVEVAGK